MDLGHALGAQRLEDAARTVRGTGTEACQPRSPERASAIDASPDRRSGRLRRLCPATIDDTFRMFVLKCLQRREQLLRIVAVLLEQLPATLADLVDERIGQSLGTHLFVSFVHSSHSISGVTIWGVRSPNRRLITVKWRSLLGLAR